MFCDLIVDDIFIVKNCVGPSPVLMVSSYIDRQMPLRICLHSFFLMHIQARTVPQNMHENLITRSILFNGNTLHGAWCQTGLPEHNTDWLSLSQSVLGLLLLRLPSSTQVSAIWLMPQKRKSLVDSF